LTTQASTIAVSLTVSSVPLLSFSTAGFPGIPLGSGPSSTPLTVTIRIRPGARQYNSNTTTTTEITMANSEIMRSTTECGMRQALAFI
jgi:hypothetical protein